MGGGANLQDTVLTIGGLLFIGGLVLSVFKVRDWLDAKMKASAEESQRLANAAAEDARLAHEKIALLQSAVNAYQLTQAERLVSREVLREVEERLAGAIEKLGDRLDSLVKELMRRPDHSG
jgi:hypothetical protein